MATPSDIRITPYWSVEQVAEALDVHSRTVRRWIHAGLLPAVRVGSLLRISDAELQAFVKRAAVTDGAAKREPHEA